MASPTLSFDQLKRRPLFRLAEMIFRGFLTPLGCVLALLTILTGATAGSRGSETATVPVIYMVNAFCSVFFGLACVVSFVTKPKLRLNRRPVPPTTAGEDFTVEIEITNQSPRPAFALDVLELNLPETISHAYHADVPHIDRLESGATRRVRVRLHATRRGSYTLKRMVAGSSYPFGICRGLRRSRQATSFLVYPAFTPLEQFQVPEGRRHQPGGFLISSKVGESPEFMGTREYRDGDNIRHLHWASWARVGKPVIKQYHEEFFVRLALVIDTHVPPKLSSDAFESGISLTAAIADYLSRSDYLIDIFAAGPEVFRFQSGRSIAHFENILEILACLEPARQTDWQALSDQLEVEAPQLSAVLLVLLDWTPEREKLVQRLKKIGVGLRVLLLTEQLETAVPHGLSDHEFVCMPIQNQKD
ncbi:MAG: DUF58 domain-containing protein [Blastocatellia bacterium]|nr:DUF58 domain-containing protein [Blastocatellia bacterium]